MATLFSFQLQDQPGELARVAEMVADQDVNINGIAGISCNGKGCINLVTNNDTQTESVLTGANITFEKFDVFFIKLSNTPGQVAKFTRALADAGVNLTSLFITIDGMEAVATNNNQKAIEVAQQLGVFQKAPAAR